MTTVVFTDGACIGNPGPGGWAWAVSAERLAFGAEPATTNQRMELQAAIEAVTTLPGRLEVVSDSTYVVNCFRDRWWSAWRARDWRNTRGQPVANRDLWSELVAVVVDDRPGEIAFRWVKGHAGDPMNELVDRLANDAARSQLASSPGTAGARLSDGGGRPGGGGMNAAPHLAPGGPAARAPENMTNLIRL